VLTFTATSSGVYYIDAGAYGPGAPMAGDSTAGQYGLSVATGTRAHFDEMMGAAALLVPDVSWGGTRPGRQCDLGGARLVHRQHRR
jgi:hypothetical protein